MLRGEEDAGEVVPVVVAVVSVAVVVVAVVVVEEERDCCDDNACMGALDVAGAEEEYTVVVAREARPAGEEAEKLLLRAPRCMLVGIVAGMLILRLCLCTSYRTSSGLSSCACRKV